MSQLGPLSPDPPGQLDVLGHDGDPLGVDGAQVGVLEEADQVGLGSLLKKDKEMLRAGSKIKARSSEDSQNVSSSK